jgi:uncharacterized membrane protein YqgA involved in biofilm formation
MFLKKDKNKTKQKSPDLLIQAFIFIYALFCLRASGVIEAFALSLSGNSATP